MKNKITIQLSAKKNFVSWATNWITRGKFSHVDIILSDDPYFLYGAHLFGGIKRIPTSKPKFLRTKRYEIEISNHSIKWIKAQVGRKYDVMAIAGFILRIPIKENSASICSAFVFDALEKSDCFDHEIDYRSTEISPRDLHLILQVLEATGGCIKK